MKGSMIIVLRCQECGCIRMVIDSGSIDKSLYAKIGEEEVAGTIVERYKPGDVSYKQYKFFGEVNCSVCDSTDGKMPLFPEDEEKGPDIEVSAGTDDNGKIKHVDFKNRKKNREKGKKK